MVRSRVVELRRCGWRRRGWLPQEAMMRQQAAGNRRYGQGKSCLNLWSPCSVAAAATVGREAPPGEMAGRWWLQVAAPRGGGRCWKRQQLLLGRR